MSEPYQRLRRALLDPGSLVRAVAAGRRRGAVAPAWRRVELRYVDLKAGRRLQVTTYDATQAHTANHTPGPEAEAAVDALLEAPYGSWHVDTATDVLQLRVTKKGRPVLHTRPREEPAEAGGAHDREKARLLPADDPVLIALGIATPDGRIKPSRQAKYRQVEELCRQLDAALADALARGRLRTPTADDPLRVVDLGCGNAYLTFAAHRFLTAVRGLPVTFTGVDVKEQSHRHNTALARQLGIDARFVVGSIADAVVEPAPEVVLALHACDTATDEALARAVEWGAALVLAAPCCHHDLAAQLKRAAAPGAYALLTEHGILRERFADTLTDAVRAALLRTRGYQVDVVEFVESAHTPRNSLIRAVRGAEPTDGGDYAALVGAWGVRPRLGELLGDPARESDAAV